MKQIIIFTFLIFCNHFAEAQEWKYFVEDHLTTNIVDSWTDSEGGSYHNVIRFGKKNSGGRLKNK